jgi:hypothetical protein
MSTPYKTTFGVSAEDPSFPVSPRRKPVSLLACTYCRYKHLKCDAKFPTCSRCRLDKRDCQYLQSKRGHKRPRKPLDTTRLPSQSDRDEGLLMDVMETRDDSNNNIAVDQVFSDGEYQ